MALKLSLVPIDHKADREPMLDPQSARFVLADARIDVNPVERIRLITDEVSRLNRWKIDTTARWHLLEEYFLAASSMWSALDAVYANVPHPMRGPEALAADLALANAAVLAMGYKRILAEVTRLRSGPLTTKIPLALINRCQQTLARMLAVSYLSFRPVPPHTWHELHQIYQLARDNAMATTPFSKELPSLTPELAYIQMLLLSLANPYGFLPGQLSVALIFLGSYAHLARLTETPPVHRTASGLAVVPISSDQPPMASKKVDVPERAVALFLHCHDIVYAINRHVQELESGVAAPSPALADSITQTQYMNFVERLLREWGVSPQRHEIRSAGDRVVGVCTGLTAVCTEMAELESSRSALRAAEAAPHPRATCSVINQTDGGFSLRLESAASDVTLRVGEVVGLIERRQRKVPVGVIRWLRFDGASGQTRFGVEVMSASPELARVALPDDVEEEEHDAIVLAPTMLTDEHSSLLVRPGVLALDVEALLGSGSSTETIVVTRLVEQTLTFERFEFIPVE